MPARSVMERVLPPLTDLVGVLVFRGFRDAAYRQPDLRPPARRVVNGAAIVDLPTVSVPDFRCLRTC